MRYRPTNQPANQPIDQPTNQRTQRGRILKQRNRDTCHRILQPLCYTETETEKKNTLRHLPFKSLSKTETELKTDKGIKRDSEIKTDNEIKTETE